MCKAGYTHKETLKQTDKPKDRSTHTKIKKKCRDGNANFYVEDEHILVQIGST